MKNNYQSSELCETNSSLVDETIGYIYSKYLFFDKKKLLLRYDNNQMKLLCSEKYHEYYVSPFQKVFVDQKDYEYIYTTFTNDKHPVQTCGIYLNKIQEERLTQIELI
ncbi:hypothetical protein [Enterococcus sp. DIV1368e]|uniref:hypothetical protein n=1 Tax=unclassified Enterococcus TaxID=2608891 RepID=UPI0037A0CDB3